MVFSAYFFLLSKNWFWSFLITVPLRPEIGLGLFYARLPHHKQKRRIVSRRPQLEVKKTHLFICVCGSHPFLTIAALFFHPFNRRLVFKPKVLNSSAASGEGWLSTAQLNLIVVRAVGTLDIHFNFEGVPDSFSIFLLLRGRGGSKEE